VERIPHPGGTLFAHLKRVAGWLGVGVNHLPDASADRAFVYPQIGTASTVVVRDRFTSTARALSDTELRHFMELTAANELDVITHSADMTARYGRELEDLMRRAANLLSSRCSAAWRALPATAISQSAVVE
jgi:hypothetical protein